MNQTVLWTSICLSVAIGAFTNSIATVWAKGGAQSNYWLAATCICAPFVFISYGIVSRHLGMSIAVGTIDSLLVVTSVMIGMTVFREWRQVTLAQILGIVLSLSGVALMNWGSAAK